MKAKLKKLRARLKDLEARAAAKIAEIKDDTPADAARAIEADHTVILEEVEEVRSEIAEVEAAIAAEESNSNENLDPPPSTAGARAAAIFDIGTRAHMDNEAIRSAIAGDVSVDAFRQQAFDHLAGQDNASRTSPARIRQDEQDTMRAARSEALSYAFGAPMPEAGPSQAARAFMNDGMVATAIALTGHRGFPTSFRDREEIVERAAMTTSDFPIIMSGAINRVLEGRYALARPTYRQIARQRNFRDFRAHTIVKTGDFPLLEKVAEDGLIKFGKLSEGSESLYCYSYAKCLAISRQLMINDDLGAITDMLSSYGATVALFEEITFYASALNATLSDNKAVFHSGHSNLAAAGAAIDVTTVSAGRAAMGKQKTLDGNPMMANNPSIILCGPDTLTSAEMLTHSIAPTALSDVNIFVGKLMPLSTPQITGNEWYLLPRPEEGSNYRWGYLEGYLAPRVRIDQPFGRQGMAMTVEHDFGCGAVDYRFGYKNAGA